MCWGGEQIKKALQGEAFVAFEKMDKAQQFLETQKLEGVWGPIFFEKMGIKQPASEPLMMLEISKSNFVIRSGDYIWAKGNIEVHGDKPLKEIDFLHTYEGRLTAIQPGIYALQGKELKICLAMPEVERPKEAARRRRRAESIANALIQNPIVFGRALPTHSANEADHSHAAAHGELPTGSWGAHPFRNRLLPSI